jgi:membrane-associated phospholipid phosphatase
MVIYRGHVPEDLMNRIYRTELLILACCVAVLSVAAHIFTVLPFDLAISQDIRGIKNPAFAVLMQYVSIPGNGLIPVLMIGGVTILLALRRLYLMAYFMVLSAVSILVAALVKLLVGRPRPPSFVLNPADLLFFVDRYSYPSGHVLFYVVFFGFVAYLSYCHLKTEKKWLIISSCAALIVLIAPSRIYLGAHWASDAIGSYITGGMLLLILIVGYRTIACREVKKTNKAEIECS